MQFFTGISRNTQSKLWMLSLTECVWDFQNNALWDTHQHALLTCLVNVSETPSHTIFVHIMIVGIR